MSYEGNKVEASSTSYTNCQQDQSSDMSEGGGGCWWSCWWQERHTVVLLGFLGITIVYITRINLSIAIVAMVGSTNTTSNLSNTCPAPSDNSSDVVMEGEFDWNEQTQGLILGAFFYGYIPSNFFGGRMVEYLGPRLMFGTGVVGPSVLTLLSPLCASVSSSLFVALRVMEGLIQGVTFPSMHYMMSAWIPPKEKAKFSSMIFCGMQVGTVLANAVGGWLCSTNFLGGWPSAFYLPGIIGVIWGIPWFLLARDRPEYHPRISQKELTYILTHRSFVTGRKTVTIPWRSLGNSVPFWTLMVTCFGYSFGFNTLLTELPTYLSNMMHFDMGSSGLMAALPYLVQTVVSVAWGIGAGFLTTHNKVTINILRKVSTGFALYGSGLALLAMTLVGCDSTLALVFMSLGLGAQGAINSGSVISEQDIAPNLAGTLKGITNSLGSVTGILAPLITGAIINNNIPKYSSEKNEGNGLRI
ncbi:Sialin-like 8 [Homarus americanus]|uniref:Sialin n=1 Tax=Homarus americanus TaxID=6706 RepID=A0A8J5MQ54_HOMAM|nr:Sialin-like 8 [Homarus americanus]